MPDPSEVVAVVREWIEKAEDDLKAADYLLGMREQCPTQIVCFHGQQCIEKYLRAFLVFKGIVFPRTHDIGALVELFPENLGPSIQVERLTRYATELRYPGNEEPVSLKESQDAVTLAQRVRLDIRRLLPETILQQ